MNEVEFVISSRTVLLGDRADQDFLEFVQKSFQGIEIYQQAFIPGVIYASSKSWKVVGNIGTVAGILSAALSFYQAAKPEEKNPTNPAPQIIIKIENAGHHNVFHIGTDIKDEQEIIKRITDSLRLLQTQPEYKQTKSMVDSLRYSPHWKRLDK